MLQYWFFYWFNQFNDLHEADWEGMQIVFEADSAREALRVGPAEIGLFQHAGGEKAHWDDEKVKKKGTHPVVHPGAGSHATFYESTIFLENGENGSGLGCDNTTEELRELRPRAQLIPTHPARDGPYGWATYRGMWGEQEEGFNTGRTGRSRRRSGSGPSTRWERCASRARSSRAARFWARRSRRLFARPWPRRRGQSTSPPTTGPAQSRSDCSAS